LRFPTSTSSCLICVASPERLCLAGLVLMATFDRFPPSAPKHTYNYMQGAQKHKEEWTPLSSYLQLYTQYAHTPHTIPYKARESIRNIGRTCRASFLRHIIIDCPRLRIACPHLLIPCYGAKCKYTNSCTSPRKQMSPALGGLCLLVGGPTRTSPANMNGTIAYVPQTTRLITRNTTHTYHEEHALSVPCDKHHAHHLHHSH
jgi:hypothetical protein